MLKLIQTKNNFYARSFRLFGYQRIWLGKNYWNLSIGQREAILAHEKGHIHYRHTEKRLLALLYRPFTVNALCKQQEFEADKYAAEQGCWLGMFMFLTMHEDKPHPRYPSHKERIKQLEIYDPHRLTDVNCQNSPGAA